MFPLYKILEQVKQSFAEVVAYGSENWLEVDAGEPLGW